MYSVQVRKLVLRLAKGVGMSKASRLTAIGRTTIWRWRRFGVDPKRRSYERKLFDECKNELRECLLANPTFTSHDVARALREQHGIRVSSKSIRKFIKNIGFSRKRTKLRGRSKRNVRELRKAFCDEYTRACHGDRVVVSVDECAFSEKLKPFYGYSPIGEPVVVASKGGWAHHSLLMAVFSDGRLAHMVKKGSVNAVFFKDFIESLNVADGVVVLDNASIHSRAVRYETFLHTPPYTPEFNAIELCFGIVKARFRKLNVGGIAEDVRDVVRRSVEGLSPVAIVNSFRHTLEIVRRG